MKIWITEDDSDYVIGLQSIINAQSDIHCDAVFKDIQSLKNALHSFSESSYPDVVLLDIHLPDDTGINTLPFIKSKSPGTAVVMLTIAEDADLIFTSFQKGASGYLLKDTPGNMIIEAIRHAKEGGTLMPPTVAQKVLHHFQDQVDPEKDYGISNREKEVLKLMSQGLSQKGIAEKINLSPHTVNSHLQNIYLKLQVNSGIEAVTKALREKLI